MHNPNRYDSFWIVTPLDMKLEECPFEGATAFTMIAGQHTLEVLYEHGRWWMVDELDHEVVMELCARSLSKAWVLAMRRARALGFY